MNSRLLSRLVAPLICGSYVSWVLFDRFAYHEERKKEILEERRKARDEAASRIAERQARGEL